MTHKSIEQYGLTSDGKLTEEMLAATYKYARVRILPYNELGYHETDSYRRSTLHNHIADFLDLDRDLVEKAFSKAAERFHARLIDGIMVDGSVPDWEKYFDKIVDKFCDNLMDYANNLNDQERHPLSLTEEQLDSVKVEGMPSTGEKGK